MALIAFKGLATMAASGAAWRCFMDGRSDRLVDMEADCVQNVESAGLKTDSKVSIVTFHIWPKNESSYGHTGTQVTTPEGRQVYHGFWPNEPITGSNVFQILPAYAVVTQEYEELKEGGPAPTKISFEVSSEKAQKIITSIYQSRQEIENQTKQYALWVNGNVITAFDSKYEDVKIRHCTSEAEEIARDGLGLDLPKSSLFCGYTPDLLAANLSKMPGAIVEESSRSSSRTGSETDLRIAP